MATAVYATAQSVARLGSGSPAGPASACRGGRAAGSTPQVLEMAQVGSRTYVLMDRPGPCGFCRTVTIMFCNHLGSTRCFRCSSVEAATCVA